MRAGSAKPELALVADAFAGYRLRLDRVDAGHAAPRWFFSPKNTQPFQRTPVISRAMAESDL